MVNQPAPYCNITVATPASDPAPATGMRTIPNGASLQQAIQIMNQNFRVLFNGFNGSNGLNGFNGLNGQPGPGGPPGTGSSGKKAKWQQSSPISVTRRIFDQNNPNNYIDVVQVQSVTVTNETTGDVITISAPGG